MKFHNLGTLVIQDNYGHGEIEMLEILAYAEKIIRHGIIQQKIPDFRFDFRRCFLGAVFKAAAIADLGVENLACRQGFVLLDQVKQIIRKHIISAPHNVFLTVRSAVGVDGVGPTENGSGFVTIAALTLVCGTRWTDKVS